PDPDTGPGDCSPRRPYSVLLPVGFAVPLRLPATRCALTAPFHPCRGRSRGGPFSVALSLRSRRLRDDSPADVIRHRMSMEPGLSSPATFRSLPERPSGRLTCGGMGASACGVKGGGTRGPPRRTLLKRLRGPGQMNATAFAAALRGTAACSHREGNRMASDFEDHCWKDIVPPDVLGIYAHYERKTFVGPAPALIAIDLYELSYQGGARPVAEVAKTYPSSCGENAFAAIEPTKRLFAAARAAGLPIFYSTMDTRGDSLPSKVTATKRRNIQVD